MAVDQEQLFGAPLGDLTSVGITYHSYGHDRFGVTVHANATRTNRIASVRISWDGASKWPTVCGAITPVLARANRLTEEIFRRHAWAVHDTLGRQGFEVEITNCGRQKKI